MVFTLLRQAATAVERFIPDAQSALYRQHLAGRLWQLVLEAEAGSDLQLQLVQAFLRHAREEHAEQVAQLAAKQGPPGFSVSTDMAWIALQRLVAMCKAGEPEIDAALEEDDTSTGYLAAIQARAMIPMQRHKALTWEQLTGGTLTNMELRHIVMGFTDVHEQTLLARYTSKYFEQISDLWAANSYELAETLTLGLYPSWDVSQQTAEQTRAVIEATPHSGLKRLLTELHDDVLRALAARAAF